MPQEIDYEKSLRIDSIGMVLCRHNSSDSFDAVILSESSVAVETNEEPVE